MKIKINLIFDKKKSVCVHDRQPKTRRITQKTGTNTQKFEYLSYVKKSFCALVPVYCYNAATAFRLKSAEINRKIPKDGGFRKTFEIFRNFTKI